MGQRDQESSMLALPSTANKLENFKQMTSVDLSFLIGNTCVMLGDLKDIPGCETLTVKVHLPEWHCTEVTNADRCSLLYRGIFSFSFLFIVCDTQDPML